MSILKIVIAIIAALAVLKLLRILLPAVAILILEIKNRLYKPEDFWFQSRDIKKWAQELHDALDMEVSREDIRKNKEAADLHRYINQKNKAAEKLYRDIRRYGAR